MKKKIKEYFLDMSAGVDEFGGTWNAEEISTSGVICGIVAIPFAIAIAIIMFPFKVIAKILNSL